MRKAMRPAPLPSPVSAALAAFARSCAEAAAATTDEAKAKAAEAAAKTAWTDKVDAYQLCKAQDRVAARYRKSGKPRRPQGEPPPRGGAGADGACALRRPRPPFAYHRRRLEAARGRGRAFAARHGDHAAEHQRHVGRDAPRQASATAPAGRRPPAPLRTSRDAPAAASPRRARRSPARSRSVDEYGERAARSRSRPSAPLTVYVDKRELVTLMTLGARPSCWCSATCATSGWSSRSTTSNRSPSTGRSAPPR